MCDALFWRVVQSTNGASRVVIATEAEQVGLRSSSGRLDDSEVKQAGYALDHT